MKRLIVILLLFVPMLSSAARRTAAPPFVRTELNTLQMPAGASPTYDLFLRKIDTLVLTGRTDVRVLHVGGSHVQGGTLTDRLRTRFLSLRYGLDGGRGLVFPFSAAGTNTPVSYSSSYSGHWESGTCLKPAGLEMGLSGMAVTARDTSARVVVDLLPREPRLMQHRYMFNKVDVLGEGSMEPVLLLGPKDTLRGVKGHFDLPYYTDWVQLAFAGKGDYTLRGMYLDRPNYGFTLCESGVNGASTLSWTRCELWEREMHRLMPDLVIFSIGVNDIQGADFDVERFKEQYRELVKAVRRVNPYCAILFTGINDSYRRGVPNPHTEAVQEACREIARECAGVFWDWYAVMGGSGSMERWQEAGLAQPDKVHFTPAGYRLVGDLLFEALLESHPGLPLLIL